MKLKNLNDNILWGVKVAAVTESPLLAALMFPMLTIAVATFPVIAAPIYFTLHRSTFLKQSQSPLNLRAE